MRVAILGADSFSGRALAKYLAEREVDIRTFGRSWDIREPKALATEIKNENPDVIVNFIAKGRVDPSWDNPRAWFDVNVGAPCDVIKHLIHFPLKAWIQISTPEVCGTGECPETFEHYPSTPYATSKAAMEMMLEAYRRAFGFPYIITRCENVYGAEQEDRLIPNAMEARRKDATLGLTSPDIERSFIHIEDVCSALQIIMERGKIGEIYNIGLGRLRKLSEVVDMIGAKWVRVPGRRVEDQYYGLCSDKLRHIGWEPKYTLEEGLKKTWDEKLTYCNSQKLNGLWGIGQKNIDKSRDALTRNSSTATGSAATAATSMTAAGDRSRGG